MFLTLTKEPIEIGLCFKKRMNAINTRNQFMGDIMADNFDAIVVGGGPGGSSAAFFLAKKYNRKVLLLEKETFPRDKPCGDAVSGKSMSVLADMGVLQEVEEIDHYKTHGVILSSPKGTIVEIPFKTEDVNRASYGYVSKRYVHDNFIFKQAKKQKNVTVKEAYKVTDLIREGTMVIGVKATDTKKKKEYEFFAPVVIGADGANGIVAGKLGVGGLDEKHNVVAIRAYYDNIKDLKPAIEIHFVKSLMPGYFWIFPVSDTEANVGVGMLLGDMKKNRVNLQKEMLETISSHPLFKERFGESKLVSEIRGWNLPLGSKIRPCAGDGYVLVGDAASLIDPFSGEGVGNALYSGRLAAEIINKAFEKNDFSKTVLCEYEGRLHDELDDELKLSYHLQRLGSHESLLNWVIEKAATKKEIRDTISGMLVNTKAKKGLANPLFYVKLLLT